MPQVKALACPNCGGTVQLRGYAQTVNAVCENCLTILDARTPELAIIQTVQTQHRIEPAIPLGTRGKLDNTVYEGIGFQERSITVEGIRYAWREYLLFNPFKGYRYLTEYNGHWNDIRTLRALPETTTMMMRPAVRYNGRTFTHFQRAQAATDYVLGEFPWQVRVGDTVEVNDYVSAPEVISSEVTPEETVWSLGSYIDGAELWRAFQLKTAPPARHGVYANQPSPYTGKVGGVWRRFLLLTAALFAAGAILAAVRRPDTVFEQRYAYASNSVVQQAFVTAPFDIHGTSSNVDIRIATDTGNEAAFVVSLINDDTGVARDFSEDVQRSAVISTSAVPGGHYYLRVEPQIDADPGRVETMNYTIKVNEGGVSWFPLWIAFFLLLIPPVVATIRRYAFESARWRESDYGSMYGVSSSSSSSEDDD